jgi:hypothetical protein
LTGIAVKTTLVPGQIVVDVAEILILTGRLGLTVIAMLFDVAGLPVTHVAFDVKIQVTRSELFNTDDENVVELDPALTPFTCH